MFPDQSWIVMKVEAGGSRDVHWLALEQGSSNLSLEGQSAAQFSFNPDQTHLSVIF